MIIKEKQNITLKTMVFVVAIICIAIAVVVRVMLIQTVNPEKYEKLAMQNNFRKDTIKAPRGNIYTSDGVLLATTTMKYHVYLDLKTINQKFFDENINALSDSLSRIFPESKSYYKEKLIKEKNRNNQFMLLVRDVDFEKFKRMRNFPIFSKGQNKGGFIVKREVVRSHAVNGFGTRLLGFDNHQGKVGLEGAFSRYLRGKDAIQLEQRINSKQWKPINYWEEDPIPGKDVYTTIDMRIQDITHSALQNQLKKYKADRGCAVVMEVTTGKIKAMVNLKKIEDEVYDDIRNYAIYDKTEPGSTFKVVSLLAAMDDGYIDENTTVNVGNGTWNVYGKIVTDEHSQGTYDLVKILSNSSNIGTSKLIHKYYGKAPEKFFEKLSSWKVNEKLGLEIKGESEPTFPNPNSDRWSPISLITSSYGYGLNLTPLQILTFYNGIANNGTILQPLFLERVEEKGKVVEYGKSKVRVPKITSQENIDKIKSMLTQAVEKGTAKSIHTPNLKMAGKTGTTRVEYWIKSQAQQYQSSFCGFFPTENPMYSCIVVIQKPQGAIYGGLVAAPVFKEIAGKVFLKLPLNIGKDTTSIKQNLTQELTKKSKNPLRKGIRYIPNLEGCVAQDVIPDLENLGLRVKFKGTGRIKKQSLPEGYEIVKGQTLYLDLE